MIYALLLRNLHFEINKLSLAEKGICPLFLFPLYEENVQKRGHIYVLKVERGALCSWIVSPKPKNAMFIGSKIFKRYLIKMFARNQCDI